MQSTQSPLRSGKGITVLGLLLLIIALVIAAVFLVRYLRTRPAVSSGPRHVSPHQPLDQLDLAGVIQIVRGHPVNLLRVRPHPSG
jgi:flagellar biogenesis protein FliO